MRLQLELQEIAHSTLVRLQKGMYTWEREVGWMAFGIKSEGEYKSTGLNNGSGLLREGSRK
jgi:hypothetical protein